MGKVIWKFSLEHKGLQTIEMPANAQILCVQTQFNDPHLWAIVETTNSPQKRFFCVIGTGQAMPHSIHANIKKYIGTYQTYGGNYIFHVFEINAA